MMEDSEWDRQFRRFSLWAAFSARQKGVDRILARTISNPPAIFNALEWFFRLRYRRLMYEWIIFYGANLGYPVWRVESEQDLLALARQIKEEQGGY